MTTPQSIEFGWLRRNDLPYDGNNNLATIIYTPSGGQPQTIAAPLPQWIPYIILVFSVLESLETETQAAICYGKINSAAWRTYVAKSCLVLNVSGEPRGTQYYNTYRIAYRADTWDVYKAFTNVDGSVPSGIASVLVTDGSTMAGNGWGRFQVFGEIDFGTSIPNIT